MVGTQSDLDTVLELYSNPQRRVVFGVLVDQRQSVTVDELTEAILDHEHDNPPDAVDGEAARRIRTRLHHVHLPKLEAAGLVEYNAKRQIADPTAEFDRLERELAVVLETDSELATSLEV